MPSLVGFGRKPAIRCDEHELPLGPQRPIRVAVSSALIE